MAGAGAVAGGMLGMVGAQEEANASKAASWDNYRTNMQNARIAEQQSAEDERLQRVMSGKVIGSIRANYGASGVSASEGSAQDVIENSAANAELDALKIRHQGAVKAWQYRTGASRDLMEADSAERKGKYAIASSFIGAASGAASGGMFKGGM